MMLHHAVHCLRNMVLRVVSDVQVVADHGTLGFNGSGHQAVPQNAGGESIMLTCFKMCVHVRLLYAGLPLG